MKSAYSENFGGCSTDFDAWAFLLTELLLANIASDFFLCGVVKDKVYAQKPRAIDALKQAIRDVIADIDSDLCRQVCRSVPSRLQKCIEVGGAATEIFWASWHHWRLDI